MIKSWELQFAGSLSGGRRVVRQPQLKKHKPFHQDRFSLAFPACIGLLCLPLLARSANTIDRYVVSASSNSLSASNAHSLYLVVGEPVIGQVQNSRTTLVMGFVAQSAIPGFTPSTTRTPDPARTATQAAVVVPETYLKIFHNQINPNHGEQMRIRWAQPADGPATLRIFNMSGDNILTLADRKNYIAGQFHEINWNGSSQHGQTCGSGIYIVLLETPGYRATAKGAVIK